MWGLIIDGVIREVASVDPKGRFHEDLQWVSLQGGFGVGDLCDGSSFSHPAVPAPSLADRRAALANERYAREGAGVWFKAAGAGAPALAASDAVSQAKLGNAYQLARDGFWVDGTPWKMAGEAFVAMTAADIQALALKVAGYVTACYAHESQLSEALATDLSADVSQGWPVNA